MTANTDSAARKPRLACAIATVFGLGRIPKAPGTFGSIAGLIVTILAHPLTLLFFFAPQGFGLDVPQVGGHPMSFLLVAPEIVVLLAIAFAGVWSASKVANHMGTKDPQCVVIDEVSGQQLCLVLALAPIAFPADMLQPANFPAHAMFFALSLLNLEYLGIGLLLFRIFDIWKPFPARQLEKLPGGWGIMADDWMAGVYAAIVLRVALHFHLL